MKGDRSLVVWGLLLILPLLVACGGTGQPETTDAGDGESPRFVYVSPDPIGVNDFLILGEEGLDEAATKWDATTQVLESEDPTTREENVRAAVNEGADIVMVLGFEFSDIIKEVAPTAPDTHFLIVDQCIDDPPPNVSCAVFREHEGAFLIGATAASLTEQDHVGVVGAVDIPFLHRFTDGFALGAKEVNPDIRVDTLWVGGDNPFADPARAKEQAIAMAADGADHIFAAAAAGNFGVFEAAEQEKFMAYGVDVNQCPQAPDYVVENMIKRVDVAVVQAIDAIMEGEEENFFSYGLKEGGVGLVSLDTEKTSDSVCVIMEHPDVIERIREIRQQIIDGEITIEDPMFSQ